MERVDVAGRPVEYEWYVTGAAKETGDLLVFLHEGLGSVELWRGFPAAVAEAAGRPALAYSRHGHGRSAVDRSPRTPLYLHHEAQTVLPELLALLGIDHPVLVGHSDGASIAIVYAGSRSGPVAGLVLIAPHVFVEDVTIAGIEVAREAFLTSDLPSRMARYHHDASATFWRWADIWLSPEFRGWNIESFLPGITCPVLLIQGADDEYATLAQLDALERGVRGRVERLVIPGCGHSPHLEYPEEMMAAIAGFVRSLGAPSPVGPSAVAAHTSAAPEGLPRGQVSSPPG